MVQLSSGQRTHQFRLQGGSDYYRRLAKTCPVKISPIASVRVNHKSAGYEQVSFRWQNRGWQYQARWHSRLPTAKLVTRPSWRVDRVKPGCGFGTGARSRQTETWSGCGRWIASARLHQSAWRVNHHRGNAHDDQLIKRTHRQLPSDSF